MTLLKNENVLPLDRDVRKVAVIGPHADTTMVGFPHYTYPAALSMLRIAAKIGKFPMPGLEPGAVPPEGFEVMNAELATADADVGGPHQGVAIADALFGVTNPCGKLPFTIPRHVGQVPIHHGQKTGSGYRRTKADIHKGYLDLPSTPLFAFGHGLSYTEFEYGPLQLERSEVAADGVLRASITIKNIGARRGTEVVQLYASDTATGVTLPAQQLVGFARVDLEAGESETVAFEMPISLLAYTGLSGALVVEPGPVELAAGTSSSDLRSTAMFTITGETHVYDGEERAFLSLSTVGDAAGRWSH